MRACLRFSLKTVSYFCTSSFRDDVRKALNRTSSGLERSNNEFCLLYSFLFCLSRNRGLFYLHLFYVLNDDCASSSLFFQDLHIVFCDIFFHGDLNLDPCVGLKNLIFQLLHGIFLGRRKGIILQVLSLDAVSNLLFLLRAVSKDPVADLVDPKLIFFREFFSQLTPGIQSVSKRFILVPVIDVCDHLV